MDDLINKLSGKPARYIFAVPTLMFGLGHFGNAGQMAGMVPIPGGAFWVYLTGVALVAGAVGVATDLKGLGKLAAFLTGTLVLIFAVTIHLPGVLGAADEAQRMMPMMSLFKDLMIGGAAWAMAATYD